MIQYLLEVSLSSIGFISFYHMALRDRNFHSWNRFFLNGSLILSLLIPLLHIPIEEIIYVPQLTTGQSQEASSLVFVFSIEHILMGIYLIGCTIMLYMFLKELVQIKRIIANSDKEIFPNYSLVKLEQEFPLCSFFNFIICNKNTEISQYELDHELIHIGQKHSYDKVFIEIVKILLWFNPAIYIYQKNIHAVHEYLADESVVELHCSNSYQQFLIQSLQDQHLELSTVNPFHSLIKNRLHMLNNKKESTKTIFLFAIPIIACLMFFISCEKKTIVIALDNSEQSNLKFAENGNIILTDTIFTFDDQTFEEDVIIVSAEMTPEEYLEMQKNLDADYGNNPDNSVSNLITVVDTIVVFNADTYEETIRYVETQLTEEEYEQRLAEYEELESEFE